jgi:hypothetical protein
LKLGIFSSFFCTVLDDRIDVPTLLPSDSIPFPLCPFSLRDTGWLLKLAGRPFRDTEFIEDLKPVFFFVRVRRPWTASSTRTCACGAGRLYDAGGGLLGGRKPYNE